MMDKILLKIEDYPLGWDGFLSKAYAFARRGQWDAFAQIDLREGDQTFDVSIFADNLRLLMEFSQFDYPQIVPLDLLRHVSFTRRWIGFVNVGANRKRQDRAIDWINNKCDFKQLHSGDFDWFLMDAPGHSTRIDSKPDKDLGDGFSTRTAQDAPDRAPTDRDKLLILAFDNAEDLVWVKLAMG